MERVRRYKDFMFVSLAIAAAALLGACNNPIDLLDEVRVEVMKGNDRFLEVVAFGPENSATEVSPSAPIWIEFDRALDTETVTDEAIVLSPSAPWTYSYNETTKTLSVQPSLDGPLTYTVRITTGLKGIDGRSMYEDKAWSFRTKLGPSGTISINSGAKYTTSNSGNTLSVEANAVARKYRYSLTAETLESAPWTAVTTQSFTLTPVSLSGAEGTNGVYIQFWDDESDYTSLDTPIGDSIILDTVAPLVTAFAINGDDPGTSTSSVTLSQAATDATSGVRYMQFMNYGGSWSALEKPATSRSWALAKVVGTRQVSVRFQDAAGNVSTAASDAIVYGAPTMGSATLNGATIGTVTASWSAVTADAGTNTYGVYRRDYPAGSRYTFLGSTTATSLNVSVAEGSLYYFHVAVYNDAVGGTGEYSSAGSVGFTSDIAIVHADADAGFAASLKTMLTNGDGWVGAASPTVSGTIPGWTVTLVPESLVSSTYSAANVLHGDPVIVTPNSTLHSTANKVRNVTAHGRGVVAMGYAGAYLLDVVEANFSAWGYTDQIPDQIGHLESAYPAASYFAFTWSSAYWSTPLSSTSIPDTPPSSVQLAYSNVARVGVYRSDDAIVGGNLYCRDNASYPHYFPVARQGRFMQFGFQGLLDRPYTGKVFTVNMVYRMSLY